jgi:hypothetical protein
MATIRVYAELGVLPTGFLKLSFITKALLRQRCNDFRDNKTAKTGIFIAYRLAGIRLFVWKLLLRGRCPGVAPAPTGTVSIE